MLAGGLGSCREENDQTVTEPPITGPYCVAGTIIGTYFFGGVASFLVQVDEEFPIGKTYEHVRGPGRLCVNLPDGTHQNMIEVQPFLPLPGWPTPGDRDFDWSELEPITGRRISFSYRELRRGEEGGIDGDFWLYFIVRVTHSVGFCPSPDIPTYIITNVQILN